MRSNRKSDHLQTTVSVNIQASRERPRLWTTPKGYRSPNVLGQEMVHAFWAKQVQVKIMRITQKTTHKITYQYTMEHTSLESVQHTKYLGVTISDDLRWNRHVADITGRANKLLGLLRRNLSKRDRKVRGSLPWPSKTITRVCEPSMGSIHG